MSAQVLDSMDIERERGITIKAQSVTLDFKSKDGETYQLNFIDTPGHVDFSYEVSRSLAACEGALLVVDAAQGVEAQSVANCYTAIEQGLEVVPVLNKIDLPSAEPERVMVEIEEVIGIPADEALKISAKTGLGVIDVLEQLVLKVPPPQGNLDGPLQALIIDSWFDSYLGVLFDERLDRSPERRVERGARAALGLEPLELVLDVAAEHRADERLDEMRVLAGEQPAVDVDLAQPGITLRLREAWIIVGANVGPAAARSARRRRVTARTRSTADPADGTSPSTTRRNASTSCCSCGSGL